jgi:hypothetical protein
VLTAVQADVSAVCPIVIPRGWSEREAKTDSADGRGVSPRPRNEGRSAGAARAALPPRWQARPGLRRARMPIVRYACGQWPRGRRPRLAGLPSVSRFRSLRRDHNTRLMCAIRLQPAQLEPRSPAARRSTVGHARQRPTRPGSPGTVATARHLARPVSCRSPASHSSGYYTAVFRRVKPTKAWAVIARVPARRYHKSRSAGNLAR